MLEAFRSAEPSRLPEMNHEQFLGNVEALLQQGVRIGVAADFDGNISVEGASGGLDPRESTVNPQIRAAFQQIIDSGHSVTIISSRGAQDVAQRVNVPGVTIVGTLGWETLDNEGHSHIHDKFAPYRQNITNILRYVREAFLVDQLGRAMEVPNDPSIIFSTRGGGTIVLQRKGYNDEYPEGINHTWALNMVSPEERAQFAQSLEQYYRDALRIHTSQLTPEERAKLEQLCGFIDRPGTSTSGKSTLDIEIRPRSQGAKAHAGLQLLRSEGRESYMENMPRNQVLIYSGDHITQDWPVGRAGHLADRLTHGQGGIINVWTRQHQEEPGDDTRGVDFVVDGVNGNAQLLTRLAELFARYPQAQSA